MNSPRWAFCGRDADAAELRAWLLQRQVVEPAAFRLKDIDDLDAAIRDKKIHAVLLSDAETLLHAAFDRLIDLDLWHAHGVRIEFLRPPPDNGRAALHDFTSAWSAWHARRRARQIAAGLILSAAAIASATAIILLATARGPV